MLTPLKMHWWNHFKKISYSYFTGFKTRLNRIFFFFFIEVKVCQAYEANKQQVTLLPVPPNVRESSGSEISGVLGQRKCNSFNLLASKVCHLVGFNLVLELSGSTQPPWLEVKQTSPQGDELGLSGHLDGSNSQKGKTQLLDLLAPLKLAPPFIKVRVNCL